MATANRISTDLHLLSPRRSRAQPTFGRAPDCSTTGKGNFTRRKQLRCAPIVAIPATPLEQQLAQHPAKRNHDLTPPVPHHHHRPSLCSRHWHLWALCFLTGSDTDRIISPMGTNKAVWGREPRLPLHTALDRQQQYVWALPAAKPHHLHRQETLVNPADSASTAASSQIFPTRLSVTELQ